MHAPHMRHQLISSMKNFTSAADAAPTFWYLAPKGGFSGGMYRRVVTPQLRVTGEGTACACIGVAHELSILKNGADLAWGVLRVGQVGHSPGLLVPFWPYLVHLGWKSTT